jgi:hypothetical protein
MSDSEQSDHYYHVPLDYLSESEDSQNESELSESQNESEMSESEQSENYYDLPLNFFLFENNPYIKFFYNEVDSQRSKIVLNLSPSITYTFSIVKLGKILEGQILKSFYLENVKELKKNYERIYLDGKITTGFKNYKVNIFRNKDSTNEIVFITTHEITEDDENYLFFPRDFKYTYKSSLLLPNSDFQPFFDYLYDLTQTRRQRLFLKLNEKKSYVLYSLAFYKSQSNKNETIYLTISDLPSIKEPVKQEIVKLNTVYYALNGIRFNTDNKFISTILTEDSLLSIIEFNEKDPLTNLKIEKIDPVLFVLKVIEPQPVSFVNPRKNLKRSRSFGGGLKLKKRLKSKSPKKINRK